MVDALLRMGNKLKDDHKHSGKKRKSESNEDGDKDKYDKGNLVIDDGLQKKVNDNTAKKKKRKRDSYENEPDQNYGLDVQKDCDPKPEKKKIREAKETEVSMEDCPEDMSKTVSTRTKGDGLVRGKRFTPEEDEIVKQAVLDYITANDLGDEGLNMVLNCKSYPEIKKCWQHIGLCIPYRPHTAIYGRAHILFERAKTRSWTPKEIESLKEFHEKHGENWKKLAEELGKYRAHVKDTWRRIKLKNLKGGKWGQEEYQNLYDLVNSDLLTKMKGQEKRSKHGMLRDNISWTAISEKLSTRSDATCCTKWYSQLTSSLVAEKKWCDADDYRMMGALYEMDAACVEDVDWDNVLEHRPGEVCLRRWNQMVKHIGDYGSKTFGEQVDVLAKRYCPDLAETREVWDSKPVVP